MTIPLPPATLYLMGTHLPINEQVRAIQREAMLVAIDAAMLLKADAMEIFNSNPAMTPQETRDVIEWYDGSLRALEIGT